MEEHALGAYKARAVVFARYDQPVSEVTTSNKISE